MSVLAGWCSPTAMTLLAYVLVPLYVEKARGETVEQAVLRSNFDEVWKVLQGLKEQDDLLAQIIAEMRIERGRTGGFDDSRFRERVELLGPELSLETLRSTITAACLDAIGESWFERYGQLLAYKQEHGNCDMSARWQANQKLATWVVNQRVLQRDGVLEPEKVELLNRIAFKWNPHASNWRTSYLALLEYKKRFGNCRVPQDWKENKKLARWVSAQRLDYGRGELLQERIALLEKIGFEWKTGLGTWDERFAELCAFKERFGHTRVKVKWSENPLLGAWVVSQRYKHRRKELRVDYVQRLDSIGFEWDGRVAATHVSRTTANPDKHWRVMFERFKVYVATNGVAVVSVVDEETKKLSRWMLHQRQAKKRGDLSESRISALNEIGFLWQKNFRRTGPRVASTGTVEEPATRTWDEMFSELVDFFKLHGHCNVPDDWTAQPELDCWVTQQRRDKNQNRLTPEQVSRLEEIGFAWSTHDGGWDAMFAKLVEHMRPMHNGKPRDAVVSDELRGWMLTQRQFKKRGDLNPEREKRLTGIGFEWEPFSAQWETMFSRLRAYHAEHGNCRVPSKWPRDQQLASWVGTQRMRKSEGKLLAERIAKLDTLKFEWIPGRGGEKPLSGKTFWETMFHALQQYKQTHGDCLVPQRFKENRKLAEWVSEQRMAYNRERLDPDRVRRLDEVGFEWDPVGTRWEKMFQQLVEYKKLHGDTNVPQRSGPYAELGTWVRNQRAAKRYNRPIIAGRGKRLDEIGFIWQLVERDAWERMLERLLEFKKVHGHCNVPQKQGTNKRLGKWVNTQRTHFKRGKLKPERQRQLDAIGFVWNLRPNLASP